MSITAAVKSVIERIERGEAVAKPLWLVWSHEHGQYWAVDGNGYTLDVAKAGRFSLAAAKEISETWQGRPGIAPDELIVPSPELVAALLP